LIQNAALHAFTDDAGGELLIAARRIDSSIELQVSDNGKGMPPEVLARVFEPFFTTRLGQGGSGLGLAVARNIVRGVLGGSIHAESVVGAGSCFTLRFPRNAPEPDNLTN
jgi:signal transduction histidine kinase